MNTSKNRKNAWIAVAAVLGLVATGPAAARSLQASDGTIPVEIAIRIPDGVTSLLRPSLSLDLFSYEGMGETISASDQSPFPVGVFLERIPLGCAVPARRIEKELSYLLPDRSEAKLRVIWNYGDLGLLEVSLEGSRQKADIVYKVVDARASCSLGSTSSPGVVTTTLTLTIARGGSGEASELVTLDSGGHLLLDGKNLVSSTREVSSGEGRDDLRPEVQNAFDSDASRVFPKRSRR